MLFFAQLGKIHTNAMEAFEDNINPIRLSKKAFIERFCLNLTPYSVAGESRKEKKNK